MVDSIQKIINAVETMNIYGKNKPLDKEIKSAKEEVLNLVRVVDAAIASVKNQAWSGVCDEDVILEDALKKGGFIE